ncbi:hypothetical protein sS8_3377 [Methylocaldum marinum]|uniref:Uncharacterized protein n=1 Tax=Methylocaldum marinum TaxID=1432792 RepID=A0A250KUK5_9GAMM|nr:hypothetical protein [Methylocaldum marinum]BBA35315.1 hypothetical protein sS8_3377 [Methylocaldum marinum]
MNRFLVAFLFAFIVGTSPVAAQTIDGGAYFSPITDNVQPLIHGSLFSKSYLEKKGRGTARSRNLPRDAGRATTAGSIPVRFDPAISREVRDEYIASIERSSGTRAARSLGRYYASNDVHALLRKAVSPYGLRIDDFGDVTTAYFAVMWMTANDAPLPGVDEVSGLRMQTHAALADRGRVPDDAVRRQRVAESLMYQTVTLIRVRETAQAAGNRDFLAQLADSAQDAMARQGVDLRALALTDAGFRPR